MYSCILNIFHTQINDLFIYCVIAYRNQTAKAFMKSKSQARRRHGDNYSKYSKQNIPHVLSQQKYLNSFSNR